MFIFKAYESNDNVNDYIFLRINLSSFIHDIRSLIINETTITSHIESHPKNLFIQLDRAKGTQILNPDFVTINSTIVFKDFYYKFIGVSVFEPFEHYHSIIKISEHYFDFDEKLVSPLFLDNYSVSPSSYTRCLDCSQSANRSSILFLYTLSNIDDLSIIQLSPIMQNLMSNHAQQTNILHFHEVDGNERYVEISNKDLVRQKITLSSMPEIDFFGTMKFNTEGIPNRIIEPIEANGFQKLRQIFQWISQIFRHFKQFDSGKINSYLILNQLGHSDDDDIEFIRVQGFILYDIITNALLPKDNLDFDDVKAALQEIKDAYEAKYNDVIVFEQTYEATFADIIDEEETYRTRSADEDYSFISNNIPPRMECVSSNKYATIYHTTTEELQKIDFVFSNDENGQIPIETNSIDNNNNDDDDDSNDDELNECTDDNQFFLLNYNWRERVEILEAKTILEQIRNKVIQRKSNKPPSEQTKSGLKRAIKYEFMRDWEKNENKYRQSSRFAKEWIEYNVNSSKPLSLVIDYNKIIEAENNDKKENEKKSPYYTLSVTTIKHWLQKEKGKKAKKVSDEDSEQKQEQEQEQEQEEEQEQERIPMEDQKTKTWGGKRNFKLNDDVLLCLICLVLDFPNFSASSFVKFLNSEYGPCCANNIKKRTVQNALHCLKFTVKKAHFCPPARNSIGFRIYRIAWAMFLDEISNKEDVLIGFIDEAGVTVNEGSKYGRSYLGVTPMINSPLSSCKVSVLSCVFPGFGVLYRFYGRSILGKDYAAFLHDAASFLRIHICSSKAQIVLIEDNCKIHRTKEVENVIDRLKLGVLPDVPYSPALNGVVEGYFGFVKMKHTEVFSDEAYETAFCDDQFIRESWINISDSLFTVEKTKSLYAEWKARLAECVMGIPMVPHHIEVSIHQTSVRRLKSVPVFRNHKETQYKP